MIQAKMTECRASTEQRPAHRAFVAMWKSCIVPVMFVCAFFMRWSTSSSGRPAYGGPAQCRCPPQSAANGNHLWGRGGVAGWPQSPSRCVVESSALGRPTKVSAG